MTPRERLADARLYLVCDARPRAFLDAALRGGADLIQLRDKTLGDEQLVEAAATFRAAADAHGALFILNDRPDLVEACAADGVHVGQEDETPAAARAAVGPDRIVGRSTHAPFQADAADADDDVDYMAVGPVHATPTKPGRPGRGPGLRRATPRARSSKPWFAIGGLDATTLPAAVAGRRAARGRGAGDHRGRRPRGGGARTARIDGGARWGSEAVSGARRGTGGARAAQRRGPRMERRLRPLAARRRDEVARQPRAARTGRAPAAVTVAAIVAALIAVGNVVLIVVGSDVDEEQRHGGLPVRRRSCSSPPASCGAASTGRCSASRPCSRSRSSSRASRCCSPPTSRPCSGRSS